VSILFDRQYFFNFYTSSVHDCKYVQI